MTRREAQRHQRHRLAHFEASADRSIRFTEFAVCGFGLQVGPKSCREVNLLSLAFGNELCRDSQCQKNGRGLQFKNDFVCQFRAQNIHRSMAGEADPRVYIPRDMKMTHRDNGDGRS